MSSKFFSRMAWIIVCVCSMLVFQLNAQPRDEGPGGPDGPGGPEGPVQFDPNRPPVEPKKPAKPVPPAKLEFNMSWLDQRDRLLAVKAGMIPSYFRDGEHTDANTTNPIAQRFREYFSEKYIVSEWKRTSPLGHGWSYPVPEVTETIDEIDRNMVYTLEQEALDKYPDRQRDEYIQEAEELYKIYQPGEFIELTMARGKFRKAKGHIKRIGKDGVLLNEYRMMFKQVDMSDEQAARFFPAIHKKVVEKYADESEERCKGLRFNYVFSERVRRMPEALLEANYVPNHIDFLKQVSIKNVFKKEHWISRRALVVKQQRILWEKNSVPNGLQDRVFAAFMATQGYEFLTKEESANLGRALRSDETNRHVEWVPRSHVAQMRKWMVEYEEYLKQENEYAEKMKKYNEDMERYKVQKAEFDTKLKEFMEANPDAVVQEGE